MRVLAAVFVLAMHMAAAATTTTTSSPSSPSAITLHSDLFYSTATRCDELTALSTQQDLAGELLPSNERFDGTVTLTKSDDSASSSGAGCVLHLVVQGKIGDANGGFSLVDQVDQSLAKLVKSAHVLRGSNALDDLTLQRVQVQLNDNREYALDTQATTLDDHAASEVTVHGQSCSTVSPSSSSDLLDALLPSTATRLGDVVVLPGDMSRVDCAMGLNVVGRAPPLDSTSEVLLFVQSVDEQLNDWINAFPTTQPNATAVVVQHARVAFTPAKKQQKSEDEDDGALIAAATASDTRPVDLAAHHHLNAPTKQITLGVLMGISVLSAMLFGIIYQKKRHEQSQTDRHNNASQAAQIRRVSYRMGYQHVEGQESPFGGQEEEEEKSDLL